MTISSETLSIQDTEGACMSEIRNRTIQGLNVGDTFTSTRTFTEADTFNFADITRDYNPIHFDDRFTEVKNTKGRICHGLLVGSMLTEIGGQIGWLASKMKFRFTRPVYFGDTISCTLTITEIDNKNRAFAEAQFKNHQGFTVLEAKLAGVLPGDPERRVLSLMVQEGDPTNKIR
jgi:3-hydroxybutyryl-CoA dehydratase